MNKFLLVKLSLSVLVAGLAICGQTSCTCVNQQADEKMLLVMGQAQIDLKPLASSESSNLTIAQHQYLNFYGVRKAGEHQLGSFPSGDLMLAGQFLEPAEKTEKGTVIMVHGYFDHAYATVNLINYLVGEGYHVAIFDHAGHGLSDGKRVSISDFGIYRKGFSDFLDVVSKEYPPPYGVVAHSMGSTVVIDHLDKNGTAPIRRLVFLAPLIKDTKSRGLHLLGASVSPFADYLIRIPEENSSNKDYRKFTVRDPLQFQCVSTHWAVAFNRWRRAFDDSNSRAEPPLIIYAGKDTVVDNDFGREWLSRVFPDREEVEIEGAGHQLLNETDPIRERVLDLISGELSR